MPTTLAITSSDQAAGCLRRTEAADSVLAWFDPLHIGPVRDGMTSPEALAEHRAAYFRLQSFGFSRLGYDYFAVRNRRVREAAAEGEIVLYFQSNLLDQLQLLEALDCLGGLPDRPAVRVVHVDGFIDELSDQATAELPHKAVAVTEEAFDLARVAWQAYRQPTPRAWAELRQYDTDALPYLGRALLRALQELPHVGSGLTWSQTQILELLKRQKLAARDLYRAHFGLEPNSHLEDWVFFAIVDGLADGPYPLIEGKADVAFNPNMALIDWRRYVLPEMRLTSYGAAVLRGEVDDRKHNGTDHWWGGTHLRDDQLWRWDSSDGRLVSPTQRAAATQPAADATPASEMADSAA